MGGGEGGDTEPPVGGSASSGSSAWKLPWADIPAGDGLDDEDGPSEPAPSSVEPAPQPGPEPEAEPEPEPEPEPELEPEPEPEPEAEGEPEPEGERAPRRSPFATVDRRVRRRRRVRIALVVIVVAGLAATLPLLLARGPLERGRADAFVAREALASGDLAAARQALDSARTEFSSARRTLRNPLTLLVGFVPGLGSTARTAGLLARAGEVSVVAAGDVVDAVASMPDGIGSIAPAGGRFPLEVIAELAPAVRSASDELSRAHQMVVRSPDLLVAEQVRVARRELGEVLARVDRTAASAASLVTAMPEMLGSEGPRTYFFGASNPAELRGTGGFIGVWGLLRFDDGRLEVGDLASIHDLPDVPPERAVDPPSSGYADRYDRYEARWSWLNANVTPDFPSAAQVYEGLYETAVGEPIDGMIVADPFAIQALLSDGPPLEIPGIGPVDAGNVVDVVTNEAYARFDDQDERQEVLATVAAGALRAFMAEGISDTGAAVDALGEAVGNGHLLFHATDADLQARLEAAGVAGSLGGDPEGDQPGDVMAFAINSQTSAKVDYFLEMASEAEVRLLPGGAAQTLLTIRLTNRAPTQGQPEYVIGPTLPGLEAGDNRFLLDVFCAPSCSFTAFDAERAEDEVRLGADRGHPALGTRLRLPSGETETIAVQWETAAAWTEADGEIRYRLRYAPLPLVRPPTLDLRIVLPPDLALVSAPSGAEVVDGVLVAQTAERGVTTFEIALERPPLERLWTGVREELRRPVLRFGGEDSP
jgi:hypothetical protein